MGIVAQFIFVYGYLCLPRTVLTALDPGNELAVTQGWFDRRLAYAALLLATYHAARLIAPKWSQRGVMLCLHLEFLIGSIEVCAVYATRVGFSALFFYHVEPQALYVSVVEHWLAMLGIGAALLAAQWMSPRVFSDPDVSAASRSTRVALILLVLFAVRSADILRRHGVSEEFSTYELVRQSIAYRVSRAQQQRVALAPDEYQHLSSVFGIAVPSLDRPVLTLDRPRNLVTIYVEGLQSNVVDDREHPALTPALATFATTATHFTRFFNAVTPTINALVSSQCGALIEVENQALERSRGLTRDLRCLSDWLHDAGYYQVYMGGADSAFAGKDRFFDAHRFDEVWGRNEWTNHFGEDALSRNVWGLYDHDLVRYAVRRLPDLSTRRPFHLALLTLNTHPPGFLSADCPSLSSETPQLLNAFHCTDAAIALLLTALETGGYLQDTVVAIIGDHTMFPTAENAAALGSRTVGWYGRVFMAIRYPGSTPRTIETVSYTPDFAPIAMEALGFHLPSPLFIAGRSSLFHAPERTALLAPHFLVVDQTLIPQHPNVTDDCSFVLSEQMSVNFSNGVSACERKRLVAASQFFTRSFAR